jgi:hypothetical protein
LTKALLDEAGAYETLDQKAARLRGEATTDEAESKKQAAGNVADFAAQVKAVNLLTDASKLRAQANKDENEADQQYIKETIKQANEDIAVETNRGELIISNLEAEAQAHDKIMAEAMVGIEHDWNTTDNQKWEEKQMLLAGNVAWLTQYQGKLEAIASNPLNPVAVNQKAASASGKAGNAIAGAQGQLDGMGPAPTSFTQNFSADLTKLQNQWGTLQQSMASGLTGVINTGLTSVETNLEKLVMGTETWRKALLNIVTAIEGSVVSSFIQMGVKWVATQVMMAVEGKATAASSAAAMLPIAMAESEIWAGPAALATIASWGGAAIAAPELVLASIAATQGLAGFSEGGYTGKGGIVHEEEFVFSAPAVRNIGVGNLERAHNMAKNPSSAPSQAVGSGGSGGPHFHFHNDFNEAFRAAHKNRANEKYLVDTARRTSRKM